MNLSKFQFQITDQLCPIHQEYMRLIGDYVICTTCVKEDVIHAQEQHSVEILKHLLQQRLSNSGLKK